MPVPDQPITLTPAQLQAINENLSSLRHNVNNYLSLIVAATEVMRRRPEMANRLLDSLVDPPQKITTEIRDFSDMLEQVLHITRP